VPGVPAVPMLVINHVCGKDYAQALENPTSEIPVVAPSAVTLKHFTRRLNLTSCRVCLITMLPIGAVSCSLQVAVSVGKIVRSAPRCHGALGVLLWQHAHRHVADDHDGRLRPMQHPAMDDCSLMRCH
jgi:hypothetical protein